MEDELMGRDSVCKVEIEGASREELNVLYAFLHSCNAEYRHGKVDTFTTEIEIFEIEEAELDVFKEMLDELDRWEEV
jgi:hypothetical protein